MPLLGRIRRRRGYGIHSPLVYRVVREAMMPRRLNGDRHDLYDALRSMGVGKRSAVRLQNYYEWAGCDFWTIDLADKENIADGTMMILTPEMAGKAGEIGGMIGKKHVTLCLLSPRLYRSKVNQMIEDHNNISIENRGFAMFFYGGIRPKQHFKL